MACPVLKTLNISFTAPSPIPQNGYRVKWRVVGTSTYTTAVGPFVSSPALVTNVPACENVEGTIEAVCGAVYSSVATFVATKEQTFVCGNTVSGSTLSPSFYIYPRKLVDLNGSADSITINYDVSTIPNRINVYNSDNTLVVSSGWKGEASYAGPWGATLSTANTGSLNFLKSTAGGDQRWYTINAEHAGNASVNDAWSATISCVAGSGGSGGGSATYAVAAAPTSINEGGTATFTVTTTNVANGTTLYWTIAGTPVAGDFADNTTFGTVVINNNTGTITRTASNDLSTEGAETFTLSLRTGSSVGTVVATSPTVTIVDSSTTPSNVTIYNATRCDNGASGTIQYNGSNNLTAGVVVKNHLNVCYTIVSVNSGGTANAGYIVSEHSTCNDCAGTGGTGGGTPTYSITPSVTSVNEGSSVTFTINTTNVSNNTPLYWIATGSSNFTGADFSDNADYGMVTVQNNTASIVRNITGDGIVEGNETFSVTVRTGSVAGPVVATSATVTIVDLSSGGGGGMSGVWCTCNGTESFFLGRETCVGACEEQTT